MVIPSPGSVEEAYDSVAGIISYMRAGKVPAPWLREATRSKRQRSIVQAAANNGLSGGDMLVGVLSGRMTSAERAWRCSMV